MFEFDQQNVADPQSNFIQNNSRQTENAMHNHKAVEFKITHWIQYSRTKKRLQRDTIFYLAQFCGHVAVLGTIDDTILSLNRMTNSIKNPIINSFTLQTVYLYMQSAGPICFTIVVVIHKQINYHTNKVKLRFKVFIKKIIITIKRILRSGLKKVHLTVQLMPCGYLIT